ncbi:hypothetical protein B0H12DRAFT_1329061 [Mycena haematopus]|nr:hypothetical protein B0H12DRAFT_1329061 [Mycena haematopus]
MSTASSCAADRARIAEIEAQILSLRDSIQVLEAEKKCTQGRLDAYTYLVLTLPNEITSEIFTKFIPVYPSPPPFTGPLSPTTLTHICRKWREIALTTPALWRAILFPSFKDENSRLCLLKSWLSRSGCLPLSFEVQETIWNAVHEADYEALILHCARWEYVTLALDTSVAHTIHCPMPVLRQFELRPASLYGLGSAITFRQVPRLRSLTLPDLSYDLSADDFPWAQLTSLTLVCHSFRDCTAALQHTPNLVHCHLALCEGSDEPAPQARLPLLESLVFSEYLDAAETMTEYLECLITPALRTLEIPERFFWPEPLHALGAFISNSRCHLQGLCITGRHLRSKDVYRHIFPDIPELSFDESLSDYDSYSEKLAQRRYVVL